MPGFWRKNQVTVLMTTACNLQCSYCYMPKMREKIDERTIDVEFAKIGIKDFFCNNSENNLRFFSPGEPTQAFPQMKEIYEYAKNIAGTSLTTELESNGYFDKVIRDWIASNISYFWISCDGKPEWQERQRIHGNTKINPETIYENIRFFVQQTNLLFGVSATISEKNLDKQVELIDFFHSLGIKYVCGKPIYSSHQKPHLRAASMLEFAKNFVPAFYHAKELGMFYQTLAITNFDEKVTYYCQAHTPTPRLTPDGFVSCCDWASVGPHHLKPDALKELIYGYYDKDKKCIIYDEKQIEKIKSRNVDVLSQKECRGCEALYHCAGGCVGKMSAVTNDFYKVSDSWCEATRYLFQHLPIDTGDFPFLHP